MCLFLAAGITAPAYAGPPYLTDDPVPTDTGHWEIYGFASGERTRSSISGDTGLDLNYGPVEGLQLTATLPLSVSREHDAHWSLGTGDVEAGVKYRFFNDDRSGLSAAIFPRVILPTSSIVPNARLRLLLPIWLGKDFSGGTSLFGGGGYQINPGSGNRDFLVGGLAVTQKLSESITVGGEVAHQGPDTDEGRPSTSLGLGASAHVAGRASLLFSAGPTLSAGKASFHFYAAVSLNF
jgi:hypothetical protein